MRRHYNLVRACEKNLLLSFFDLDDINSRKEGDYEKIYGEVNRIEKEIEDLKSLIMEWAVKERAKIWT